MKEINTILILLLAISSSTTYSQEKLEVEGAIIIKNTEDVTPAPGTLRFNPATCDLEGWNGIFWASLTSFQLGSVTDIDGNVYKTVAIGTQEWMAQNLRTTKYRNGDVIPNVTDNNDWGNLDSGAYCWYNNDNGYEQPYGKLYNWYAVNDTSGLCPTGWHVPTDPELTTLIDYLDPGSVDPNAVGAQSTVAGGPMKETGTAHWNSPNTGATNSSGFTSLPGGFRYVDGRYFNLGNEGYLWSSTESSSSIAWCRFLSISNASVSRSKSDKRYGFSVRCVRD